MLCSIRRALLIAAVLIMVPIGVLAASPVTSRYAGLQMVMLEDSPRNLAAPVTTTPYVDGVVDILTVGDSITYGASGGTLDSYRGQLDTDLTADGVPHTFAVRAVPGAPCQDLASSFNQWLTETNPDIVVIMCGANDARLGISRSATRSALDSMAGAAVSYATHPATYFTYIPYDYLTAVGQVKVDREADVNNAVADVTTVDYPYKTAAVDLTMVPGDRFHRISDGVHMTDRGNRAIGREIARSTYFRNAVGDTQPAPPSLCGMYGRYYTNAEPNFVPCTNVSP